MSTKTTNATIYVNDKDKDKIAEIKKNFIEINENFNKKERKNLDNLNKLLTSSKLIQSMESLNINGINYPKDQLSPDFFNTLTSSILQRRNEKYLNNLKLNRDDVTLFGIHYDTKNTNVRQNDPTIVDNHTSAKFYLNFDDFLIIYNENFDKYNDKNDYSSDGGNGFLRKYRSDSSNSVKKRTDDNVTAYIYGIPTGIFDNPEDIITHQDSMNDSISQIVECINNNEKIKYVIWFVQKIKDTDYQKYNMTKPDDEYASDDLDTKIITLELGIFDKCNKSVKAVKYISDILFKIFENRKYFFSNRDTTNNEHKYFNQYFIDKFVN